MKRKLLIACPQCDGGDSKYYYVEKNATCSYCGGSKKVNILDHFKVLGITDERYKNVISFIQDVRFIDYLESK